MRACIVVTPRILILLCLLPLLLAAGGGKQPPVPVKVAQVTKQALAPSIWVAGTVVSRDDARIAAEISGRLVWVAEIGHQVEEGQAVAKLENTQQRLHVSESKAIVAKEKARLLFLSQEVKRLQSLAMQNNAAKNRLEQSQADRDVAKSELNAARVRLQLAKEQVKRSELKAAFNGIVTERLKHKGEWVADGDAVVRLLDAQALEIQASVPISTKFYLNAGQTLQIHSEYSDSAGVVRTLVPVGDVKSRLMDLRIDIATSDWSVGQSVRVAIPTANPKEVLALPRDALVLRRSGVSVFKVDHSGNAQRVLVATGIAEGSLIEISGELKAGDKVIIRGGERLRAGQPVKIIEGAD